MAGRRAPRKPARLQAAAVFLPASRLRATIAPAPAPNSRTTGGAGTSAGGPPDDPVEPVEVLVELVIPDEVLQPWLLDP